MNSVVYFMVSRGLIKIGYTTDLSTRMADYRYNGHKNAELIAAVYGDRLLEKALHTKLVRHRVKREWFKDCDDVRTAIQNSLNNFKRADLEFSHGRGESPLVAIAKVLWPIKTAAELAAVSKCSQRCAEHYLSGTRDWSGDAIAAIVTEILKRHQLRNVRVVARR